MSDALSAAVSIGFHGLAFAMVLYLISVGLSVTMGAAWAAENRLFRPEPNRGLAGHKAWLFDPNRTVGPTLAEIRREVSARDVACWCPVDQPYHADARSPIARPDRISPKSRKLWCEIPF
jgi:hypothetical protein